MNNTFSKHAGVCMGKKKLNISTFFLKKLETLILNKNDAYEHAYLCASYPKSIKYAYLP